MVDREVDGQHVFSLIFFFDIFDGWSIVKLTGSMLFFDFFFDIFDWRSVVKLTGLCRWSWPVLGG